MNDGNINQNLRTTQLDAFLANVPKLIYMKDLKGNFIAGTKIAKEFVTKGFDSLNKVCLDFSKIRMNVKSGDDFVIENNKKVLYQKELFDIKGKPHCYEVYKAPVNDVDGNVTAIVVMLKNIDKLKILETQKETFVASLGHDLKNPTLAQIRALELILKNQFGKLNNKQHEIIQMVLDSCRYMNGMLATLLATYRNENGVIKLNYEEFLLSELISECVGEMVYMAKEKELDVVMQDKSNLEHITADKIQIKRVIMNLLSNGIKYAYKQSRLVINVYEENGYACFNFENRSPYIPPEKQQMIFAQYVSFAGMHNELGIGLGLYTSQKTIEAHNGEIFVKSFEDDRNVFGFKLPICVKNKNKLRKILF